MLSSVITKSDVTSVRRELEWSREELAEAVGVTAADVGTWEVGAASVPRLQARQIHWLRLDAERRESLAAAGFQDCEWVAQWHETFSDQADLETTEKGVRAIQDHTKTCPTCVAIQQHVDRHFPNFPPYPTNAAGMVVMGFSRLFLRIPRSLRPATGGALMLATIVLVRALFSLPQILEQPGLLGELFMALLAAAAAGASGGLVYSAVRKPLRRLGRFGDYLTGIACIAAYLGSLILVAPIAFGEPIAEGGDSWIVWLIMSILFGLLIGHMWFGKKGFA